MFDGISCGMVALEHAGIPVDQYVSYEIDEYAMQISKENYPMIAQCGDVLKGDFTRYRGFDLLLGGSPCQGFSIAGKQLNFNDPRSKLFFEFVRAKEECNPKWFLYENVATMSDEIADKIDELLGVKRVFVDGVNFTGMHSKRYYWTNIQNSTSQIQKDVDINKFLDNVPFDISLDYLLSKTEYAPTVSYDGIITINPKNKNGKQTWQRGRVYDIKGKLPRICASLHDLSITENHKTYRHLTQSEEEKFFGLPVGYTSCVSKNIAGNCIGNGWQIDVIANFLHNINSK